jgi:hypothetical protein
MGGQKGGGQIPLSTFVIYPALARAAFLAALFTGTERSVGLRLTARLRDVDVAADGVLPTLLMASFQRSWSR